MTFINKHRLPSSGRVSSSTALSIDKKPPSKTVSPSSDNFHPRIRFLLKSAVTGQWIADNRLVDDKTQEYTKDPAEALQFVSIEAAAERARLIIGIYTDILIDAVDVPVTYG